MSDQATKATLLSLPVELQGCIASCLTRHELFCLLLTCRRLRAVLQPQLWQSLSIKDGAALATVKQAILARPSLSKTVTKLELARCGSLEESVREDGLYPDLMVAASLPNLRHLLVETTCEVPSEGRSQEALQGLLKLEHLETCDLHWLYYNGERWIARWLLECTLLVYKPSLRQMILHRFQGDIPPPDPALFGDFVNHRRSTPLQKISLIECDISPENLANIVYLTWTNELVHVFQGDGQYPPCEESYVHEHKYIEALQPAGRGSLERLTFYPDFDYEPESIWRELEGLKFLSRDFRDLADDTAGQMPVSLETLELLCLNEEDFSVGWSHFSPLLQSLVAEKEKGETMLRELRLRSSPHTIIPQVILDELEKFGLQHRLMTAVTNFPDEWWINI